MLHMDKLDLPDFSVVDAFVIGEGEASLHELLTCYKAGTDIAQCRGIAYFKNKKLQVSPLRETFVLCKDLPRPDFSGFDLNKYTTQGKLLTLYMSRGCINKCIFCEERKLWGTFRSKSGEQLFNEIKQAKDQYPRFDQVYFSESLFNGNINYLREFCKLIIDSGIKIQWEANAVIRKEMDSELLKLMADSGCCQLTYGVETVSPRLLAYVGKIMSNDADIEKIVRDTAQAGIKVTLDFMFGLPGETEEDAQKNIDFVVRNRKYIHTIYPSWSFCYLTQLSDVYANPEKWGLRPINDVAFWESIDGSNTYPVRMARFERFCAAMKKEGIAIQGIGYVLADREKKLGYYHCFKKDYKTAAVYLIQAIQKEPWDTVLRGVARICCQEVINEIDVDAVPKEECVDNGSNKYKYFPANCTDANWENGVAKGWATALFVDKTPAVLRQLRAGRKIMFADGTSRSIMSTKEDIQSVTVFLDGAPLDGAICGYPKEFTVCIGDPTHWVQHKKEARICLKACKRFLCYINGRLFHR